MNKQLRDGLNGLASGTAGFLGNLGKSCSSLLRMCVLSSPRVASQSKKYKNLKDSKNCCVLGNGPSLKADFEAGRVFTEGNDLLCVNMFCSSPLFQQLKPRFYFLVDGAYFAPDDDRNRKLVEELKNDFAKVNWEMFLVISSSAVSGGELLGTLTNPNIKVLRMNSTNVDGFRGFRHWIYKHRMGMPRCQTVVNFALCTAIDMGYDNIYLYGADHTWTRDLFVDDDNVVCYGDRHVYNTDLTVIKHERTMTEILRDFANMFEAHVMIRQYADSVGVKIINKTTGSFVDAYERG